MSSGEPGGFWAGNPPRKDDFGDSIIAEFIDGRMGGATAWATFTPGSWRRFGCGRLGEGYGQRYRKDEEGRWRKVEG